MPRRRVLLVHTGGTLGMALPEARRLDLAPEAHLQRLLARVPELGEIADVELVSPWNLDSSDVGPPQWQALAQLIGERALPSRHGPGFDGVVLIHGTDTMAYTASALAFMLRGLDRPVVLTGSQRPLEAWRTDARANLAAAVECATQNLPEVVVVFGDAILRGCRSTKSDAHDYQAFDTPNEAPLGRIGVDLGLDRSRIRAPIGTFSLATDLDPRVLALTVFPGFDPVAFRQLLGSGLRERLTAVVVRAFGVGNVPSHGRASLVPLVETLAAAGVAVVVTSQCARGRTDLDLYAGGRALLAAGVVQARDMTFEATVTKTMWACARPQRSLAEWFSMDLAGEVALA